MGQTVVFTVSLDADDVAIEHVEPRPPQNPFRDAAGAAIRDRAWRIAALLVLVLPAIAAAVAFAITRGPWVTTTFLAAAALVTPASAAWAATRRVSGDAQARVAGWAVAGFAGAALAVPSVAGVVMVARAEQWNENGTGPTLAVLALSGAAGAWLGLALGNLRRAWHPVAAGTAAVLLVLAPLAVCAALLPATASTDEVESYVFTTASGGSRPEFVCGLETVEATRRHTEAVAWIAFGSPLAWVVDAASHTPGDLARAADGSAAQVQAWTRSSRLGPDAFQGYCYQPTSLGPPTGVIEARYEAAGPLGAKSATGAVMLLGALALAAVSWRRSPSPS